MRFKTEMVSVSEAARILGVNESTARRYCATGALPAVRVGGTWRIRYGELTKMLGIDANAPTVPACNERETE